MSLYGGIGLPDRPDPANIQKLDLLPIPMIRRMMRYGLRIDLDHFADLSARLQARMSDLRNEILNEIPATALEKVVTDADDDEDGEEDQPDPVAFNVESSQRVAELLYDVLGLNRRGVKVKKTKGGGNLTTGKKTLEQLKREHPVVQLILEYRECSKLDGTYAKAMPRRARFHPKGKDCQVCGRTHRTDEHRVHCQIMTTRTVTGRTVHKGPNLANIPIRTALGREIRAGFVAPDGCVIADRDWSQIELRLLAHLSGDKVMITVYKSDGDVHNRTACGAFGLTEDQLNPVIHRVPSKTCNFSIAYGTTDKGLYEQLYASFGTMGMAVPEWLTEQWCGWFIQKWFTTYPGAKRYLDDLESIARRLAIVWTLCGRVRRIPEVHSCHAYIQDAGVRQAANMPIQGTSADLMKLAMGELGERLDRLRDDYGIESWPINTIYDSLMVECDEDDGETVDAVMADVMDNVMVDQQTGRSLSRVPIRSDGKLLKRWTKE